MTKSSAPEAAKYDLELQIGFRLRLAMQRHTEIFFNTMDLGVTQAQYATLARLYRVGSCSQNELGRSIALDSASIVGVVGRLKANGYISSVRDKVDRRRVNLSLTDKGRDLVERAIPLALLASERTLVSLDPAERDMLIHLLRKLVRGESDSDPQSK